MESQAAVMLADFPGEAIIPDPTSPNHWDKEVAENTKRGARFPKRELR
jgi:F420-0:gamma-glutamyl ligase-like protein